VIAKITPVSVSLDPSEIVLTYLYGTLKLSDYYYLMHIIYVKKGCVLPNIFVETDTFLGFFVELIEQNRNRNFCNFINVFTVTFDQFNASFLN